MSCECGSNQPIRSIGPNFLRCGSVIPEHRDELRLPLVRIAGDPQLPGSRLEIRHRPIVVIARLAAALADRLAAIASGGIRDPRGLLLRRSLIAELLVQLRVLEAVGPSRSSARPLPARFTTRCSRTNRLGYPGRNGAGRRRFRFQDLLSNPAFPCPNRQGLTLKHVAIFPIRVMCFSFLILRMSLSRNRCPLSGDTL